MLMIVVSSSSRYWCFPCFSCFLFLTRTLRCLLLRFPSNTSQRKRSSLYSFPLILIKRSNWRREQIGSLCISCPIILCFYFLIWGKKTEEFFVESNLILEEKRDERKGMKGLSVSRRNLVLVVRETGKRQEPLDSRESSSSSSFSQRVWTREDLRHSSVSQSN